MDKQFWLAIRENKYTLPDGHDLAVLTEELISYLPSTDPELRDHIGYAIFANWINTEAYAPELLRDYIRRLTANLQIGLGERDADAVFLRSFSILLLAEIICRDNQHPFLLRDEVTGIFQSILAYLAAERDPRGYVHQKGWAHALAHTADALTELAQSPHLDASALLSILEAILAKLRAATDWIYGHVEDDRLASAVVAALTRDLIPLECLKDWLNGTITNWKGAWKSEDSTRAYFNVRNLMRAVHLQVASATDLPHKEEIATLLLESINAMRPF